MRWLQALSSSMNVVTQPVATSKDQEGTSRRHTQQWAWLCCGLHVVSRAAHHARHPANSLMLAANRPTALLCCLSEHACRERAHKQNNPKFRLLSLAQNDDLAMLSRCSRANPHSAGTENTLLLT
jgi:hypothetical protein